MLDKLFGRLTTPGADAEALFATLTGEARQPRWYIDGAVPDTLDGRFALLSTLVALAIVRLERGDEADNLLSVALTERFALVMESEHRELGLGDPTLGKTVLKLVGLLARRVELWREAAPGRSGWVEATKASLPEADAAIVDWRASSLEDVARRLDLASSEELAKGILP